MKTQDACTDASRYGRYFLQFQRDKLFTEADDDENTDEENTSEDNTETNTDDGSTDTGNSEDQLPEDQQDGDKPVYNKNTRVIEVKPTRPRLKFTDDITPEDEPIDTGDSTEGDNPDTTPEDTSGEGDTTDGGDTGGDNMEFNDDSTTDNGESNPDEPDTSTEDSFDDSNADNPEGDEGNSDEPDTSSDENFDDNGDSENTDETNADAGGEEKKGPGLEYDSTRKYNLFKNYVSLANAINNYISKLENNLGEDTMTNQVYRKCTEKLREILDLCTDYMIMKFEISSYVQSLLFFQNLVIMIQKTFDLIAKFTKNKKK